MPGDAVCETATVPVGWTVDDPICMERSCGAGGETEVQRRIALHVAQCVGAGAWIEFRNIVVDRQIEAVAKGAKAVGVGRHFVLQDVAQQRERRAVGALRVGSQVYGRNDKAAREIAANTQNRVLNVLRRTNQSLEITTVFHEPVARTGHVARTHGFRVEHGLCHARVGVKPLEGIGVDIVHDRVERIGEVHGVEGHLRACRVTALDVQAKR